MLGYVQNLIVTDQNGEDKKLKDTKKYIIKRKLKFENYYV